MKILISYLSILLFVNFLNINVSAQTKDVELSNVNIYDIQTNQLSFGFDIKNVGETKFLLSEIQIRTIFTQDNISFFSGGKLIINSMDSLLPEEIYSGIFTAVTVDALVNFSNLRVSVKMLDNEPDTMNNSIGKNIMLDSSVVAGFKNDISVDTVPFEVQFTDTSLGNPTNWKWDFDNDGIIDSEEQNPVAKYTKAGIYTVRFTASKAGFSNSLVKSDCITAISPLEMDFAAQTTSGIIPFAVNFTDITTGNPETWKWDFNNDGIIDDSVQNPTYIYENPGYYTVKLTVTKGEYTGHLVKNNLINALDDFKADFNTNVREGYYPFTVNFTDNSIGSPTSWKWDFNNDGIVDDTRQNVSWIFKKPGTYSVKLVVSNGEKTDALTRIDYIVVNKRNFSSLENENLIGLRIYPNPAAESITISGEQIQQISIVDLTGKIVLSQVLYGKEMVNIDISTLEPGLYLARIDSSGSKYILKFCKK